MVLDFPDMHEKQKLFCDSPAKRKVIVAGRRGGKTTGMAMFSVYKLLEGRRILEAAPTQDQTAAYWDTIKKYLSPLIKSGLATKNETRSMIELWNGGRIRCKTAWDADTLRGDYADLLILDEFADMDLSVWDVVGAPMLLDNDGDAVFIGTPKRRNHFFNLYQRAISDDTGRWGAWHFTSFDNPFLSKDALNEIMFDMTETGLLQEIYAQFLENDGAVFRKIDGCLTSEETKPEDHKGHELVAGVDWGKQNDYTVISVGCRDCKREVYKDRFNQIDYHFQRERLKLAFETWGVNRGLVELNSIGGPNFEELQRDGLPVAGFQTTASSKPQIIENLALCFEKQEFKFIDDPIYTGELQAYEMAVSERTGRATYSAPQGGHDDTVIARALMLWNITNSTWYMT